MPPKRISQVGKRKSRSKAAVPNGDGGLFESPSDAEFIAKVRAANLSKASDGGRDVIDPNANQYDRSSAATSNPYAPVIPRQINKRRSSKKQVNTGQGNVYKVGANSHSGKSAVAAGKATADAGAASKRAR